MRFKIIRSIAFHLHRWLGLSAGLLLCIAGLTGSVLVFWRELDHWLLAQRFGQMMPGAESDRAALPTIVETVNQTYANRGLALTGIDLAEVPYSAWLLDQAEHYLQVLINPFTGQIISDRQWETSWIGKVYELHYQLLAGDAGILIMGIVALLTLILSVTGIVLWSGWRKLIAGFRIKWKANLKRVSFDLHNVIGIITAVFLALIGFTGFTWNVPQAKVEDAIYAATLTPRLPEPRSTVIAGKAPLPLSELLERATKAFPTAQVTYISFPRQPDEVFRVDQKQPQETGKRGTTQISVDQFSGAIVQIRDPLKPSRADAILQQFAPLHFGTFGGLWTRMLYVVVGIAPTVLMLTGLILWVSRRRAKRKFAEK